MKTYFKHLIFYTLALLDAIINLSCSIIRCYPCMETSVKFMVGREVTRIARDNSRQESNRNDKLREYYSLKEKANG